MKTDGNDSTFVIGNHLLGMTTATCLSVFVLTVIVGDPGTLEAALIVTIVGALLGGVGILMVFSSHQKYKDADPGVDLRYLVVLLAFELLAMVLMTQL